MRRRDFFGVVGGGVTAWPFAASAQQRERVRRVGVLMGVKPDDPDAQVNVAALQQGLQDAGWAVARNLLIDIRWSGGDVPRLRQQAAELIALGPDVIVGGIGPTAPILQQATRTIPIVVAQSVDPVGGGFVNSMARPGGNLTGFIQFEYGLAGKWFDLLREIAPQISRVGVVRELEGGPVGIGQWAVIQAFASPMGVELSPINLRERGDTEQALANFARGPNNGLIVVVGTQASIQRELIVALAARHRLPAVYSNRLFIEGGGLMSYGSNLTDNYRRAAGYVGRAFSRARNRAIFLCKRRPSTNW
jgi:putative ABC transport system substrate-binding protein